MQDQGLESSWKVELWYSEPETYPAEDFVMQGPWHVAVGVHPRHILEFNERKEKVFKQLLEHPKVVAMGECGLDQTLGFQFWEKQEEVFLKMLRLVKVGQPLILHLRGAREDLYGSDVNARCQVLLEEHCDPQQNIHVHCCMGKADVLRAWLKKFPNVHFGVTAAVRSFDNIQSRGFISQ